jgi:hypothetical protein
MASWRDIRHWVLGENDRFGDCFFVMIANWHLCVSDGAEIARMPDGEIERDYSIMAGFTPMNGATDHGEAITAGFNWLVQNGWPTDPDIRPTSWHPVSLADVPAALAQYKCLPAWVKLPSRDGEWDLSDDAVVAKVTGSGPHAVLVVEADDDGYWLITWARPRKVSKAWWAAYGQQMFALTHPPQVMT